MPRVARARLAAGALGVRLGAAICGGHERPGKRGVARDPCRTDPERIGQRLQIALRSSLNPTGEPTPERYRLRITLATDLTNLGIESQGLASLGKFDVYATYTLIDSKSRQNLLVNTVHVANSFDLNPNQYSTVVGENDAAVRSAAELNQEIVTRLALFMERRLAEKPPAPS